MIRFLVLLLVLGSLAACEQYREPQANCFNLVSRGPTSLDCDFEALDGALDITDEVHE
ncbi:hypothetical protein [Sulfitobacter pacificus]|uniref:Lipoprotein n=1 Tax=Sulfitobacter pacificus TaxID=1499314 RepID=A0ABQ5VNV9_9RHOB|nr:hypothetical protein [Sulfitobacter pacificus]GLQ28845.1 hypothetical protein GCM10007927_36480 [Sulfitobacter pacificus]